MSTVRLVQGWNLQDEKDAALMGRAWQEQLDRHKIDHRLYDGLVQMAIDHRTAQILRGQQPTPLTVELLISSFLQYKSDVYEKRRQLAADITAIEQAIERVADGDMTEEEGLVDILSVYEAPEDMDFHTLAPQIVEKLHRKYDRFLEESYIKEGV